ncbi:MAG: 50S ribosomal protein L4 [Candidatus Nanoarchaeia archaeon]|nr:50S ribosomal protein L4 [Candidatus Nanoarchaeia archaeon]
MKASVLDLQGKKTKEINLPKQFEEEVRPDLIKRAVLVVQSNKRQPYGAHPEAGKRYVAKLSRRRRAYRGAYGQGISRAPRKIMTRRGRHMFWVGAKSPHTVGGRRAHPPKAEKIWDTKINITERRKAIRSALAATIDKILVKARGHKFKEIPLIVDSKIQGIDKTKDVIEILKKLGLEEEIDRIKIKKVRAGRGKNRGRRYRKKIGPLIVVSEKCKLEHSAINIQGVNVVRINEINTELLAPGTMPGRLTIYTDKAIEKMEKEDLFMKKRSKK